MYILYKLVHLGQSQLYKQILAMDRLCETPGTPVGFKRKCLRNAPK